MADFTLFEVHLHDGFEFSPTNSAPLLSKRGGDEAAALETEDESYDDYDDYDAELDADETDESESSGGPGMALLVGFVLLVGIAAAVRYIRGGGDDLDELADLDDEERDEVEIDA
ncbi:MULTISPECIES: hypothetical protein [Haloferax]|uniref:Uncharacterized protein n=1 Tax=Haloferax gibbonsii TaxID=35746 RepID=A0A0K1IW58_HALGI|nr:MULTISPECIES: hypothetical protein [Haloferax]AKU08762.1 hypothetical protein ABY42_13825 [Haloferax gibbonsii]QOS12062.1 uncharacterized protein HfgLR_09615 [Haloferax gibbonsii]RDZ52098.1 hypothetical protein C5C07_09900 [Haloferax sp. Atlit-4N]REA01224.1 hypothetical protein DEQ92_17895 [Haloferax sp. Atlit-6N]